MLAKTIKVKYKNGVLEPLEKVDLPEGTEVAISLESSDESSDVLSEEEKRRRFLSAAGGWEDFLDCEKFIKDVYESRKIRTRPEVKL